MTIVKSIYHNLNDRVITHFDNHDSNNTVNPRYTLFSIAVCVAQCNPHIKKPS